MASQAVRAGWRQDYTGASVAEPYEDRAQVDWVSREYWPGPVYETGYVKIWRGDLRRYPDLRRHVESELLLEPGQPYWHYMAQDPLQFVWHTEPNELLTWEETPLRALQIVNTFGAMPAWASISSSPYTDVWWAKFLTKYM